MSPMTVKWVMEKLTSDAVGLQCLQNTFVTVLRVVNDEATYAPAAVVHMLMSDFVLLVLQCL